MARRVAIERRFRRAHVICREALSLMVTDVCDSSLVILVESCLRIYSLLTKVLFPQNPYGSPLQALPPPIIYTETAIEIATETKTVVYTEHHTETVPTKTVTVPAPANTRIVASPAPESFKQSATAASPRTTSHERVTEEEVVEIPSPASIIEEYDDEPEPRKIIRSRRNPNKWWW